jgi:RNA polymerase sigma-70 factor (ECF subfamily)
MTAEIHINATEDDAELVARCLKGETEAFEGLVRRHERKMINMAYRMTGNFEEACEVVQDAFVSAYRNLKSFKGAARFSTWLYSIVANLSRNRIKKMKTKGMREPVSVDDPISTEEGGVRVEHASENPTALEELERKEVQQRVQGCIDALDVDFKEVIVLRDIQGFQYEEIAGILGLAAGTVKSRLFRARDAVRECLKKVMGAL